MGVSKIEGKNKNVEYPVRSDVCLLTGFFSVMRKLLQIADRQFPVSACAGITFVHSHFPIRIAYGLAEECCARAKKSWYQSMGKNRKAGLRTGWNNQNIRFCAECFCGRPLDYRMDF